MSIIPTEWLAAHPDNPSRVIPEERRGGK